MPKLRDYFFSDLSAFFNEDEFAETINIDGVPTKIVPDDNALKELQLNNNGEGLVSNELLFHVKTTDLDFIPFTGQDLLIGDKDELYYINDVKESTGMYTITLGAAKS